MNNEYQVFLKECIKNRKYLSFSFKDMSNCLVNVSEKDYANFEKGTYQMSKENLIRISRVLCVKRPTDFNINDYIDTGDLNEDEIKDLTKIICELVGDDNA